MNLSTRQLVIRNSHVYFFNFFDSALQMVLKEKYVKDKMYAMLCLHNGGIYYIYINYIIKHSYVPI